MSPLLFALAMNATIKEWLRNEVPADMRTAEEWADRFEAFIDRPPPTVN